MANVLFAAIHGVDGKVLSCALYRWSADTEGCYTIAEDIAREWEESLSDDERAAAKANVPVNGAAYGVAIKLLEATGARFSNDPKCSSMDGIIYHPYEAEECRNCACGELHVDLVNETFYSDCFTVSTKDEYEFERDPEDAPYDKLPVEEGGLLTEAPLTVSEASVLADITGICPDGMRLPDGNVALWIS